MKNQPFSFFAKQTLELIFRIKWRLLAFPMVASLVMFTQDALAAVLGSSAGEKENSRLLRTMGISSNNVSYYARPGLSIGTIDGGMSPYTFVSGLGNDNAYFTILPGDILVLNRPIANLNKAVLTVDIIDGADGLQTLTLNVTDLPSGGLGTFTQNTGTNLISSNGSTQAVYGDVDQDGNVDVVTAHGTSFTFARNNGDGTFTETVIAALGAGSPAISDVELADLDNDGDLDIVLARDSGETGSAPQTIFEFTGATFVGGDKYLQYPTIELFDADGDGLLDIMGSFTGGTDQRVNLNIDGLNFNSSGGNVYGISDNGEVELGDIDNDGDLDATIRSDVSITFFTSAAGSFTPAGLPIEGVAGKHRLADLDNDGDLDLVYSASASLYFRFNDGSGVFSSGPLQPSLFSGGGNIIEIKTGDIDGDGNLDVVILDDAGNIQISSYDPGNGNFADFQATAVPAAVSISSIELADFEGDGDLDLFVAKNNEVNEVWLQNGLVPPMLVTTTTPTQNEANILTSADIVINFDANLDGASLTAANITVVGSQSGRATGTFTGGGTTTITFNPDFDFLSNEIVTVTITDQVQSTTNIPANPYSSSFRLASAPFEGAFVKKSTILDGVVDAAASWGDYDNDGDLDLVVGGWDFEYINSITKIYRNDAGVFTDINASLEPLYNPYFSWGDYDNDGDLDLFLTGFGAASPVAILYDNNAGIFEINANSFTGVYYSASEWGDFDNDGDLDLVVQGLLNGASTASTILYRNDAGTFVNHNAGLTALNKGSITWGDYDNDGDLDLLSTGYTSSNASSEAIIYSNNNGIFTNINAGLTGKNNGRAEWGDYDNDGDLDILIAGSNISSNAPDIYRNDAGSFVNINAGLLNNAEGDASWGDYDGDGDLDFVINGSGVSDFTTTLYTNNAGSFTDSGIRFDNYGYGSADWGDFDGDGDIDLLITGTDDFNGGRISLYENTLAPPTILNATEVATDGFIANVIVPSGAADIILDVSTDSTFGSFLSGGQNLSIGTSGSATISVSLTAGTRYFYRAKSDFGGAGESVYYTSKGFMVEPGNSLVFTAPDYTQVFDNDILEPTGDFTIEFWFKTTLNTLGVFLEKGNSDVEYSVQQFPGNVIGLKVNGGEMTTNSSYNDGNWHHVAIVYRGPNDGTIYVDGVDDTNPTITLGTPTYFAG
ncbi:MAG: hypothetical protein ACI92W_002848, partial [Paraglaciecola sp.]